LEKVFAYLVLVSERRETERGTVEKKPVVPDGQTPWRQK
jgi:hypothetical protein